MALRLASLNIENDRHFGRFLPFFGEWKPDVLALQEVRQTHLPRIAEALDMPHHAFAPLIRGNKGGDDYLFGEAMFSRTPLANVRAPQYAGGADGTMLHDKTSTATMAATSSFRLLVADVTHGSQTYTVATTHFPWTPDGQADAVQRDACGGLLALASTLGGVVLTGDFNAPRGREIFTRLAAALTDNIPARYATSIDGNLHRAGALPYMVDGLFTTPDYAVSGVELHAGLSDHMGVTGLVAKV